MLFGRVKGRLELFLVGYVIARMCGGEAVGGLTHVKHRRTDSDMAINQLRDAMVGCAYGDRSSFAVAFQTAR